MSRKGSVLGMNLGGGGGGWTVPMTGVVGLGEYSPKSTILVVGVDVVPIRAIGG
jgi:hypothetical protein